MPSGACNSIARERSFIPARSSLAFINTHTRTRTRDASVRVLAFKPPCAAGQRKGITAIYCYSSFSSSAATNVLNPPHACKRGRRNSDLFGDPSCAGWPRLAPPRGRARDTRPKKLARPPIRFEFDTRQWKRRPPRALTSSRRELETFGHAPGRQYYRWLKLFLPTSWKKAFRRALEYMCLYPFPVPPFCHAVVTSNIARLIALSANTTHMNELPGGDCAIPAFFTVTSRLTYKNALFIVSSQNDICSMAYLRCLLRPLNVAITPIALTLRSPGDGFEGMALVATRADPPSPPADICKCVLEWPAPHDRVFLTAYFELRAASMRKMCFPSES